MLIYGALLSPYVRKVCVAAAEKGLPYQLKLTSPNSADPEFRAASPFGKIPALRLGTFTLCDSSAIIAWMEAEHPTPPLLPTDPRQHGRAVWFDEFADTLLGGATLKILFNRFVAPKLMKLPGNEAIAAEGEAELPRLLGWLESVIPAEGWLLGDFTLADISVAAMLGSLAHVSLEPTAEAYPAIVSWQARVAQRPAWAQIAAEEAALRRPVKA